MAIRVGGRFLCAESVWSTNVAFASYRGSSNRQTPSPVVEMFPEFPLGERIQIVLWPHGNRAIIAMLLRIDSLFTDQ